MIDDLDRFEWVNVSSGTDLLGLSRTKGHKKAVVVSICINMLLYFSVINTLDFLYFVVMVLAFDTLAMSIVVSITQQSGDCLSIHLSLQSVVTRTVCHYYHCTIAVASLCMG